MLSSIIFLSYLRCLNSSPLILPVTVPELKIFWKSYKRLGLILVMQLILETSYRQDNLPVTKNKNNLVMKNLDQHKALLVFLL